MPFAPEKLRAARETANLSLEQLTGRYYAATGQSISRTTLLKYETGATEPRVSTAEGLAAALGIRPAGLME